MVFMYYLHAGIEVRIDRRCTLQDLKDMLVEHVQQPVNNFKVCTKNTFLIKMHFEHETIVHSIFTSHRNIFVERKNEKNHPTPDHEISPKKT